jgi:para-nitrobenzyl esterase
MDNTVESSMLTRRTFIGGLSAAVASQLPGARALYADSTNAAPVATTQYGKIRGRMLGSAMGFLGVPYGGPAEGEGRFLPPAEPEAWSGVRECTVAGPRAIQAPGSLFASPTIGAYFSGGRADAPALTDQKDSENCLVLNVLTPSLVGNRAVMVYIHGGGFTGGSAGLTVLSDRFVSEEDVVLVGVNHRLNVFGYLYLGELDPRYPDSGNAGQLDLIAALEWVKNNIANFGGDSANVTIFGESGGGAKVSTLLAMPKAKGLFHRAIVQSGSALEMPSKQTATGAAGKLLSALGLLATQTSELRKIPPDRLLAAATPTGVLGFGAVVDGRSVPHEIWQPGAPPEAAGVSFMVGNCKDEGTLFTKDQSLFSLDWDSLKAKKIASGLPPMVVDALVEIYRKDYPRDSASDIFFRMSSDQAARANAIAQAERQLANSSSHVYMYHFDWDTPVAAGKLRAFHTADLPLEMRLVCYPESEKLSRQLAGAWAAFARSGDPNHDGLPHWEPYSLEKRATMVFDADNSQLQYDPAGEQMRLLKPYPGGLL